MPQTHGVGPLFWHRIRLKTDAPRHHRYATYEYEHPHRAAYAHVVRLVGWFGIAFGKWHSRLPADVAAMEAVKGHEHERFEPNSFGGKAEHLADFEVVDGWLVKLQ